MTISESIDDNPEVGSSTKRIVGSRINSRAILTLFLWPPLIIFLRGFPTFRFRVSSRSRSVRVLFTTSTSLSSERLDAPEVFIAFDETHSVVPEEWLMSTKLVDLIKKTFKPIIEDKELETAIKENWIEKGLPVRYQTGDESKISVPILEATKIPLDVKVLQLARDRRRT